MEQSIDFKSVTRGLADGILDVPISQAADGVTGSKHALLASLPGCGILA